MVRGSLIGLREGMVVGLSSFVAAEPANVRLHASLLLHLYRHDFDLVVRETDFDLKHVRHHELIGLNGIEVVLLLLPAIWLHHLPGDVDLVVLLLLPI